MVEFGDETGGAHWQNDTTSRLIRGGWKPSVTPTRSCPCCVATMRCKLHYHSRFIVVVDTTNGVFFTVHGGGSHRHRRWPTCPSYVVPVYMDDSSDSVKAIENPSERARHSSMIPSSTREPRAAHPQKFSAESLKHSRPILSNIVTHITHCHIPWSHNIHDQHSTFNIKHQQRHIRHSSWEALLLVTATFQQGPQGLKSSRRTTRGLTNMAKVNKPTKKEGSGVSRH